MGGYDKGLIVYDKGQIVYIQLCYQSHEIVTQQIFTHPPLSICHYFSLCRYCDLGLPPTHPLVQVHYFFLFLRILLGAKNIAFLDLMYRQRSGTNLRAIT